MNSLYFWAKTNVDGVPALSVRDHCLNVGFVAEALLRRLGAGKRALLPPGTVLLTALHDIGKISPGFLTKCATWAEQFRTLDSGWWMRGTNHAAVSHAIVGNKLDKAREGYAIAVGGHHGSFVHDGRRPSQLGPHATVDCELNDPVFAAHRDSLWRLLALVFGEEVPSEPLTRMNEARIACLTGFITLADWLGSNETFFQLEASSAASPLPLEEVVGNGRTTAERVIHWLNWGCTEVTPSQTFRSLFDLEPNAMQRALVDLAGNPGLFIVEAPMGGGKTEAALAAAYRRWTTEGGESGLYFALPTQLTSERIYRRIEDFLPQAIGRSDLLTLVHGSAWLREDRVLEIHPASPAETHGGEDKAGEVARDARLWFSSSRQALLAPFGAGTIDQALLGVLPAKHCGLRLFGLAGKVVVVDEVHSYDQYTGTLVDHLVEDLIRLNATVIVLSATLTADRKRALLRRGGVEEEGLPDMSNEDAYPAITYATRNQGGLLQSGTRTVPWEHPSKRVCIERRPQGDEAVWREAVNAAVQGASVLVIRNTVALAQETLRHIKEEVCEGGPRLGLLHSRFPRWRRDQLEAKWIRRLGRQVLERFHRRYKRKPRRKGCILVATQVVEQSVDIDADLLITDLAPTDLILQRLGRLHRHGVARPEGFEAPRCVLLLPPEGGSIEGNGKAYFGPSGSVYAPYVLWRSWQRWKDQAAVDLPDDIRRLLEETYANSSHEAPFEVKLRDQWLGRAEKLRLTAHARSKRLCRSGMPDEEGVSTRWNDQPVSELLMVIEEPRLIGRQQYALRLLDGKVVTVSPHEWNISAAKAMHANVVRVPRYAVRDWSSDSLGWLSDYFDSPVCGLVRGVEILPLSDGERRYRVTWQSDEGVKIAETQPSVRAVAAEREEDGWW